jgi:hypothetical protein
MPDAYKVSCTFCTPFARPQTMSQPLFKGHVPKVLDWNAVETVEGHRAAVIGFASGDRVHRAG